MTNTPNNPQDAQPTEQQLEQLKGRLDEQGLPRGYPFRDDWEITPRQVKALRDAGEDFLLIDCRTTGEHNAVKIDGCQLIPLHEAGRLFKEIASHLAGKKIVVYCHHGQRSLQMAAFLRYQDLPEVHSMAGGIDLWSIDIDPELKRY